MQSCTYYVHIHTCTNIIKFNNYVEWLILFFCDMYMYSICTLVSSPGSPIFSTFHAFSACTIEKLRDIHVGPAGDEAITSEAKFPSS